MSLSPKAWANRLSTILNQTHGADRFPVDVKGLAIGFSESLYPSDAIVTIEAVNLPNFEGALFPRTVDVGGWNILYNNRLRSKGRINYTLAHELGHYLIHRNEDRSSFECSFDDISGREGERIEREANEFAATLLMPLNDFRHQINDTTRVTVDDLTVIAERYRVSWTAACLRWLEYTRRSAMLVVSRDEFILWSRSSKRAFREGAYFATRSNTFAMPSASPAVSGLTATTNEPVFHGSSVWFDRESSEYCIASTHYDLTFSLLHLSEPPEREWNDS